MVTIMKCNYCGEENYYVQHVCRAEIVSKNVEIHNIETKLKDMERHLENLKARVEAVIEWDFLHLTTDCVDGRQFYTCLQLLERYYNNNFKGGKKCPGAN